MVHHIVMWNHQQRFSDEEKAQNAEKIKQQLEALKTQVEGVVSLQVYTAPLPGSNRDVMLDSVFETQAALSAYQTHPAHQEAGKFIGAVMENRTCMDYTTE